MNQSQPVQAKAPHPSLAPGDRVVNFTDSSQIFTVLNYDGNRKILTLSSSSGLHFICPAEWFERFYKVEP